MIKRHKKEGIRLYFYYFKSLHRNKTPDIPKNIRCFFAEDEGFD